MVYDVCENPANLHGRPSAATGRGNAAFVKAVGYLLGAGMATVANVCDDRDEIFVALGDDRAADGGTGRISLL
jgi:hypothetical protein